MANEQVKDINADASNSVVKAEDIANESSNETEKALTTSNEAGKAKGAAILSMLTDLLSGRANVMNTASAEHSFWNTQPVPLKGN